jgi:hypothetical protein
MPKMSKMPKLPKINVFYPLYQQHHFLNSKIKKPETRNSQHVTRTSQAISCQSEIRILKSQIERPAPRILSVQSIQSQIRNPKSRDPQHDYLSRTLPNVKKRKQALIISRLTGI